MVEHEYGVLVSTVRERERQRARRDTHTKGGKFLVVAKIVLMGERDSPKKTRGDFDLCSVWWNCD